MLNPSRRVFLQSMAAGATTIVVMQWPFAAEAAPVTAGDPVQPPPSEGWGPVAGKARYRIDGIAKVTGQKIYARDFRAADIPGWPAATMYVSLLRAVVTDRTFVGVNTDALPPALRPVKVVTQPMLDAAGVETPWFDGISYTDVPPLMVEPGQVPMYLGQPVAMLFFADEATWRAAERRMQFEPGFIEYGPQAPPSNTGVVFAPPPYYFIRYSKDGKEVFSQVIAQANVDPTGSSPTDKAGREFADLVDMAIVTAPAHGWRRFGSQTTTQTIDPMFMEPQTGMAYMRKAAGGLELDVVVGTQSPNGDASGICSMLSGATHPDLIRIYSCYPGGGFGGRDTSLFSYFLAIAASFVPGHVIRLEFDRFGQFQSGIKRNGSSITQNVAVDANGKLQALASDMTLVAGGKMNYSQYVAELAGICGAGAYAVPMNNIVAKAVQTIGPSAGSMRGFGGPQAFFAVEHLMDEIALALNIDPIDLRRRNVLAQDGYTVTGANITQPLPLREICDLAMAESLWHDRDAEKKRRAGGDTLYGVGFALANQAYGTGTDPVLGNVSIEPDGRIRVITTAVDMGNGSATSLALAPATWLGSNAHSIDMGNVDFANVLALTKSSTCGPLCTAGSSGPGPCATSPAAVEAHMTSRGAHTRVPQAKAAASSCPDPVTWGNPCYTASIYASSSACITAFQQTHVIDQVSRLLFLTGIWPAAKSLWRVQPDPANARWVDGKLVVEGLQPLPLPILAAEAYRLGVTTGVTAHALYQGAWVSADFAVGGTTYPAVPIDALAVRSGRGAYARILRSNVKPPVPQAQWYGRSLYAPSGTMAAVEINRTSGAVRLLDIVTWVDSGRPIQREILAGQYEGAVAMGFGYTFLERMPQGYGGPGDGTWNLNRYGLALAGDLPPLERMRLVTLRENEHPKGIAEAVLCPMAPALANAVAHATGRFYRSIPITAAQILEGL